MKYVVERYNDEILMVIARNMKIAIKEMKRDFPLFKFHKTISNAISKSDIGKYSFKKQKGD